jgi:hypothetical protein
MIEDDLRYTAMGSCITGEKGVSRFGVESMTWRAHFVQGPAGAQPVGWFLMEPVRTEHRVRPTP